MDKKSNLKRGDYISVNFRLQNKFTSGHQKSIRTKEITKPLQILVDFLGQSQTAPLLRMCIFLGRPKSFYRLKVARAYFPQQPELLLLLTSSIIPQHAQIVNKISFMNLCDRLELTIKHILVN